MKKILFYCFSLVFVLSSCATLSVTKIFSSSGQPAYLIDCYTYTKCWETAATTCRNQGYKLITQYHRSTRLQLSSIILVECKEPTEIAPTVSSKNQPNKLNEEKSKEQKTITLPDGSQYTGGMKDNLPEGQGNFTYTNGKKFIGEFKNGKLEGQGVMTSPNGKTFAGEFKNGDLVGKATITYSDGTKISSPIKNGVPDGHVVFTFPNGTQKSGEFKNGELVTRKADSERKRQSAVK